MDSFTWSLTDEPHAGRRRQMLARYPQIRHLFTVDRSYVWVVSAVVVTQFLIAICLKESDWTLILLQAYIVGGTFNHGIVLALHDISHNCAFGNAFPFLNRMFGIWANLPITMPMSISFKKYHIEHHRYLGTVGRDTDLPTDFEIHFFHGPTRKLIWLILQPFFYAFRPFMIYPKAITDLELLNAVVQILVDVLLIYFFGVKPFVYLFAGTFLGLGIHPSSGHFISDHYVFGKPQDTSSYYGCMNLVTYNVGYHNEHHDFPSVPSRYLPKLHATAPEFYTDLTTHDSWLKTMFNFVTDDRMDLSKRVARHSRSPVQFYHWSCRVTRIIQRYIDMLSTGLKRLNFL